MSALQGDAPWSVGVIWMLAAIVFVFTVLRIYTRAAVVKSFGMDDHVYILAFFCLLFFSIFVNVSATYGFGQDMVIVATNPKHLKKALVYCAVAQTFILIGMALAKWSLGLFLLRLVESVWHKVLIWMTLIVVAISSILSIFIFWFQCTPQQAMWDRTMPGAKCEVPQLPFFFLIGAACIFADVFFALFPWLFMWNLQMKRREKYVILCSMSLGLIAAAFGVKRTLEIPKLVSQNFLRDVVLILVWAAAEMAVTMVCIGIPVCRPLYRAYLDRLTSRGTSNYKDISENGGGGSVPLRTIGGSTLPGGSQVTADAKKLETRPVVGSVSVASKSYFPGDNQSDEEILDESYRNVKRSNSDPNGRYIHVTEVYEVTSHQEHQQV